MTAPAPARSKWFRLLAVFVLLSVVAFALLGFQRVPPEHVGVQFKRFEGGTQLSATLLPGTHWLAPWDRVYSYPVVARDVLSETRTLSSQGSMMKISYLVRFELEPTSIARLHKNIGPEYVEQWVRPTTESAIRTVAGSHELVARETPPVDEWSRLASMQISTEMETQGFHLIYFRIQSIVLLTD